MSRVAKSRQSDGDTTHRLGMTFRHLHVLCKDLSVKIDSDGNPDVDRLAEVLSLADLPEKLTTCRRVFVPLKDAAKILGFSSKTIADGLGQAGNDLRRIRVGPRIRYVYGPDLDRVLFGNATENSVLYTTVVEPCEPSGLSAERFSVAEETDVLAEDISGLLPAMKAPAQERKK